MSGPCNWMRLRIGERIVIRAFLQAMKEFGVPEHPGGKCPTPDCNCADMADAIEARAAQIADEAMAARKAGRS